MDEETRIKALAEFLDLEPEDIEWDYGNTFVVLQRPAKRGTSPKEAQRLVDQLRGVLELAIGPQTKEWTTDTFYREYAEQKAAKERADDIERELKKLGRDLPHIKAPYTVCEKCDYQNFRFGPSKCPKCKGALIRMGTRRPVRMLDVDHMSDKLKAQTLHALKHIDLHEQKLEHERNEYRSRFTYENIMNVLRIKQPDAMSIGIHEVANTLHFLMPQTSQDHAEAHRKTLKEAFDGKEPKDRREDYTADSGQYMVLTDSEADQAEDDSFDSYLDDCVLPDLPETAREYFDRDSWKEDAKADGRGHAISGYDGEEREVLIEGEWLYIYRIN